MRLILIPALLCACATLAHAQSLSLSNVDTSSFPVLSAELEVFDPQGRVVSPPVSELTLTDNGIPRAVESIDCPTLPTPADISSVLVLDVSASMSTDAIGGTRIELARAAADAWIDALPTPSSTCAITGFDDANQLVQDFTDDRLRLHAAVASLQPHGGTDYDMGLLLPVAGGLAVSARASHRRTIVFLTDGSGTMARQTEIIAEAARQNCTIYAVTLGMACPQSLRDVASASGGAWYENVTSRSEARALYLRILNRVEGGGTCRITWRSDLACEHEERSVEVTWSTMTASARYTVPESSLPRLRFVPASLYERSKPPGVRFDTTVTVTAENTSVTITDILPSNPAFTIAPTSFALAAGESRTLTISFTPADSGYAWTDFTFTTDRCTRHFFASGGYPGVSPTVATLTLTAPDGGETYVVGDDTVITWDGIPTTDTVALALSTDGGIGWTAIATAATGGRYRWHVPNSPSNQCLVRITQNPPSDASSTSGWSRAIGTVAYEEGRGIATDASGDAIVVGYFSGTIDFGETTLTSAGAADLYIARYRPDGSVAWARRDGGIGSESAYAVAVDRVGNIYVTGQIGNGDADFSGTAVTPVSRADVFVAKYDADGTFRWVRHAGGSDDERGIAIDAMPDGGIALGVEFNGTIDFGGPVATAVGSDELLLARFGPDGTLEWIRSTGIQTVDYGRALATDPSGSIVVAGQFLGSLDIAGRTLTSAGGSDIVVAKYASDGRAIWAEQAGGSQYDRGSGVAVDASGNAYVTGAFRGTASFGSLTRSTIGLLVDMFLARYAPDGRVEWVTGAGGGLTSGSLVAVTPSNELLVAGSYSYNTRFDGLRIDGNDNDLFVAKYANDGTPLWAHGGGGLRGDYPYGLAPAPDGTAYVVGDFTELAEFGGDTLVGHDNWDIVVWRVGEFALQRDTSDAVFSIVAPSFSALTVDMGDVAVGSAKDSVVTAFVRNTGSIAIRVDSVSITGIDASSFEIVSGFPPFTIDAGKAHAVEFRFHPTAPGVHSAQLEIATQASASSVAILGRGIPPVLAIVGGLVDFGRVSLGATRDTIGVALVENVSAVPVRIDGIERYGANSSMFSIVSAALPITLEPGERLRLDLRFAPSVQGRISANLLIGAETSTPATVQLTGEGIDSNAVASASADIAATDTYARPGEEVVVPIVLRRGANLQGVPSSTRIGATLRFNATLLYPIGDTPRGTLDGGDRVIAVDVPPVPASDSVLRVYRFLALLGNDTATDLVLEDPASSGNAIAVQAANGRFHLLGVCYDGGVRLLLDEGAAKVVAVRPNPVRSEATVEIRTIESGRHRLVVADMLGREVAVMYDGDVEPGLHDVIVDTGGLHSGSYLMVLTTPTLRSQRRFDVVH